MLKDNDKIKYKDIIQNGVAKISIVGAGMLYAQNIQNV